MSDSLDLEAIAIRMSEEYDRQVAEQLRIAREELAEAEKLLGKVKEVHLSDLEPFKRADGGLKELNENISLLELQNASCLQEMDIEYREAEAKINKLEGENIDSKSANGTKSDKHWQI